MEAIDRLHVRLSELISDYARLKNKKEEMEEEIKRANKRLEELSKHLIPEIMEEEGIENIKVAGIGRVCLQADLYVQVPKDKREDLYNWLDFTGRESMVTETVSPKTLKAAVKEWLQKGEDIPDCIKVVPYTYAKLTRG